MPVAPPTDPGPSTPDASDWTWVLSRRCPDCGFNALDVRVDGIPEILLDASSRYAAALTRADVRTRPAPGVWSPLEYACHVRDVLRIYDHRLERMLTEDGPAFANWDQDETAVAERYGEQDPAVVAGELAEAATVLADRFDSVEGDQWARTGDRSDGASFTVESFALYFVHDPLHHLDDVGKGFAALAADARDG